MAITSRPPDEWTSRDRAGMSQMCQFGREPPFLLRGLSYMRDLPPGRAANLRERNGGVEVGGGELIQK
jgi:hypothetical protein